MSRVLFGPKADHVQFLSVSAAGVSLPVEGRRPELL